VHPRDAECIEWDDANESELAAHAIGTRDVEDVLSDEPVWVRNKKGRSGAYLAVGYNRGGRALTIVVTTDELRRVVRPITGWDSTEGERTRYL